MIGVCAWICLLEPLHCVAVFPILSRTRLTDREMELWLFPGCSSSLLFSILSEPVVSRQCVWTNNIPSDFKPLLPKNCPKWRERELQKSSRIRLLLYFNMNQSLTLSFIWMNNTGARLTFTEQNFCCCYCCWGCRGCCCFLAQKTLFLFFNWYSKTSLSSRHCSSKSHELHPKFWFWTGCKTVLVLLLHMVWIFCSMEWDWKRFLNQRISHKRRNSI